MCPMLFSHGCHKRRRASSHWQCDSPLATVKRDDPLLYLEVNNFQFNPLFSGKFGHSLKKTCAHEIWLYVVLGYLTHPLL